MRATQENYNPKGQLAHVEKEQVDIKADIKIIQHDLVAIKENMATKTDIVAIKADISGVRLEISSVRTELKSEIASVRSDLKADISSLHHKLEATEGRLENKIDLIKSDIGWLKVINIAILTTVLGIAFAPIAQNMLKSPIQEVISSKK